MGLATQVQVLEVLVGESDQPLGGTVKPQQVEEVDRVAGMKALATRVAATPVTPGSITKMTGNFN